MSAPTLPSILFVCMGNICRSPMAEGVLRQRAAEQGLALTIDSAGTHGYHTGAAPDPRACEVAARHRADIRNLRARTLVAADLEGWDWVLVADRQNLNDLRRRFGSLGRAQLLLPFAGLEAPEEVPDPYYGEPADFEQVYRLLDRAARGLLERLAKSA